MTVPTGEKPFSCTLCGKSFPRRDSLAVHYRKIHPEEVDAVKLMPQKEFPVDPEKAYANAFCRVLVHI
jgi:hypothetical protein